MVGQWDFSKNLKWKEAPGQIQNNMYKDMTQPKQSEQAWMN